MINVFYLLSIIFIYNNIYYLLNYKKIDTRFKDRSKNSILDLFYYITKIVFWIWMIIGLSTPMKSIYILMIIIGLIRIPIFHINNKLSSICYKLTPPIYIVILLYILINQFIINQTLNFFKCSSVMIIKSYPFLLHQLIIVSHLFLFL